MSHEPHACLSHVGKRGRSFVRSASPAARTVMRGAASPPRSASARTLVHLVESTPAPAAVEIAPVTDERMQALTELHAWVQDRSDCARGHPPARPAPAPRHRQARARGPSKAAAPAARAPVEVPAQIVSPAPAAPALLELLRAPIAALPPAQVNGKSNGVLALPAPGGAHG